MTTLRGATAGAFTSNARTLTLPAGTVAGDIAVLFAFDGWNTPVISTITGWTSVTWDTGAGVGLRAYKTLTSADITAGSVTVTWNSSYGGYAALATVSATVGMQVMAYSLSTSNGDTGTGRTLANLVGQNGDTALWWAFKRKDGSTPAVSLSRGTPVDTSSVANVAGAFSTEALTTQALVDASSTVTSGGQVDGLIGVIVSDSPLPGAVDTDLEFAATPTSTALLYKGRSTATDDAAGVP